MAHAQPHEGYGVPTRFWQIREHEVDGGDGRGFGLGVGEDIGPGAVVEPVELYGGVFAGRRGSTRGDQDFVRRGQ